MGSGFLKTSLHGVKTAGGYLQTPHLQTDCLYDDLKKSHNNYVFDAILVDGAIFLKASLHGVKKAGRLLGGAAPPICKHLYHGFWLGVLVVRRYLKLACMVLKHSGGLGGGGGAAPPICKHLYHGF